MNKRVFKLLTIFVSFAVYGFLLATPTFATALVDAKGNINCVAVAGSFQIIINLLAVVAGLVFFIMTVVSGVMFLTSAGNPEGIQRAQQTLIWGVIGTLVAVGLVFITSTFAEEILGASAADIFNIQKWLCEGF